MRKKGISPLIAAVILIAFVIAIAAIAGPFLTDFFGERTEEVGEAGEDAIDCAVASFDLEDRTDDYGEIWVSNSAEEAIQMENFVVSEDGETIEENLFDDDAPGFVNTDEEEELGAGEMVTYNATDDAFVRMALEHCPEVVETLDLGDE